MRAPIVVKRDAETVKYVRTVDLGDFKKDNFHSQLIGAPADGVESAICILTRVPPGKATTTGLHTHFADQFLYILEGESTLQLGEKRGFKARPGQLVVIPEGLPHYNWNETDKDEMHFEFICPAPPPGMPVALRTKDASIGPDVSNMELIRTLDESKFNPAKFSSVVLADRASGVNSTSLGIMRVPPGGRGPGLHVHSFEQIYYIIRGTMTLTIGEKEFTAPENSFVILPEGMPHTNWNAGDDILWFINARSPEPAKPSREVPWDRIVTISKEGAEAPDPA